MRSACESTSFKDESDVAPSQTGALVARVLCRFELSPEVNEKPQLIRREVELFEEVALAEVDGRRRRIGSRSWPETCGPV